MSFHPHEQRALAARPIVFNDRRRSRRQRPMASQGCPPPKDRWGFDPDDLCRRLYHVIAEREGRPVTIRDAKGRTAEEKAAQRQPEERRQVDEQLRERSRAMGPAGSNEANLDDLTEENLQRVAVDSRARAAAARQQRQQGVRSSVPPPLRDIPSLIPGQPRPRSREGQGQHPPQPRPRSTLTGPRPMSPHPPHKPQSPESSSSQDDAQNYRHVPQVAASQFERTTTADDRNLIHKLSQPAMNFHMSGPEQDMARRNDNASPLETMHSMVRVRSNRDREYDRNQFQHPPILEELAAHDDKQFRLPLRQTFETHFSSKNKDVEGLGQSQRFSIGSTGRPRESLDAAAGFAIHQERTGDSLDEEAPQMKWRVDWTQSDELQPPTGNPNQSKLRKAESKWTLKGKLPGFQKSNKENAIPTQDAEKQTVESPLSPKSPTKSFFGRFKR